MGALVSRDVRGRRKWWTPIYRWPDGSEVLVRSSCPKGTPKREVVEFEVEVAGQQGIVSLTIFNERASDRLVEARSRSDWPVEFERKVLGFVLDLEAVRYDEEYTGLLYNVESDVCMTQLASYPRFVDDDRWDKRYDEAKALLKARDPGNFLGVLLDAGFRRGDPKTYDAWWGRRGALVGEAEAPSLKRLVDEVCSQELLLPFSAKAAWEADHVERGEWILPEPEEVGLFRVVGEPLPFWWGSERFFIWIEERS